MHFPQKRPATVEDRYISISCYKERTWSNSVPPKALLPAGSLHITECVPPSIWNHPSPTLRRKDCGQRIHAVKHTLRGCLGQACWAHHRYSKTVHSIKNPPSGRERGQLTTHRHTVIPATVPPAPAFNTPASPAPKDWPSPLRILTFTLVAAWPSPLAGNIEFKTALYRTFWKGTLTSMVFKSVKLKIRSSSSLGLGKQNTVTVFGAGKDEVTAHWSWNWDHISRYHWATYGQFTESYHTLWGG